MATRTLSDTPYIHSVPEDVLFIILRRLPFPDLLAFILTSKRFHTSRTLQLYFEKIPEQLIPLEFDDEKSLGYYHTNGVPSIPRYHPYQLEQFQKMLPSLRNTQKWPNKLHHYRQSLRSCICMFHFEENQKWKPRTGYSTLSTTVEYPGGYYFFTRKQWCVNVRNNADGKPIITKIPLQTKRPEDYRMYIGDSGGRMDCTTFLASYIKSSKSLIYPRHKFNLYHLAYHMVETISHHTLEYKFIPDSFLRQITQISIRELKTFVKQFPHDIASEILKIE